jgi:hypothetical protein
VHDEELASPKELEWAAPNFHQRLSPPQVLMSMITNSAKEDFISAMRAMNEAREKKVEYNPSAAIKAGRGAKVLIGDYTPQGGVEPRRANNNPAQAY